MKQLVKLRKRLGIRAVEISDAMGYATDSPVTKAETGTRTPSNIFKAGYRRALLELCKTKHDQLVKAIAYMEHAKHEQKEG